MSNKVSVGGKELGRYYKAVDQQLEDNDEVVLQSRGQENNGKALDVAEIVRREDDATVEEVSTSTAEFENDDGESVRVTELEVVLEKVEDEGDN